MKLKSFLVFKNVKSFFLFFFAFRGPYSEYSNKYIFFASHYLRLIGYFKVLNSFKRIYVLAQKCRALHLQFKCRKSIYIKSKFSRLRYPNLIKNNAMFLVTNKVMRSLKTKSMYLKKKSIVILLTQFLSESFFSCIKRQGALIIGFSRYDHALRLIDYKLLNTNTNFFPLYFFTLLIFRAFS